MTIESYIRSFAPSASRPRSRGQQREPVHLPPDVITKLNLLARKSGLSRDQIAADILRDHLGVSLRYPGEAG